MSEGKLIPGVLILAAIAAAFAVGYGTAKISSTAQRDVSVSKRHFRTNDIDSSGGFDNRSVIAGDSWEKAKDRLTKRWQASPAVLLDFDLHEETLRLMEKTPVEDLEAWMRQLRSEPEADYDRNIPLLLREIIVKTLAQRCGGKFVRSLAENPLEYGGEEPWQAMDAWMVHDPAAVLTWLDLGDIPEVMNEHIEYSRKLALLELSRKAPEAFEMRLALESSDLRESILEDYARRWGTAAQRAELLERASRSPHGEAMALWRGLVWREAAIDPKLAYATLAELNISTTDRAALDEDIVSSLMGDVFSVPENASAIMQDWVRRNPDQRVPGAILEAFENWCVTDTEESEAWIASQPSGLQFDLFAERLIGELVDQSDADHRAGAELAVRITDPSIRAAVLRRLIESWRAKDAAAAEEWERNLPSDDQDRLR